MSFGTLVKDGTGIPIAQGYIPGVGFAAAKSSPNSNTDGSGNVSSSLAVSFAGYTALVVTASLRTANGNSADFDVSSFDQLLILMTFTANQGTSPTIQFFLDTKDTLGNYYAVYTGAVISVTTSPLIVSLGAGLANQTAFGITARLRWVIGGSATPGWNFGGNIIGK